MVAGLSRRDASPVRSGDGASPWIDEEDIRLIPWRSHVLGESESITGVVLRLPTPGTFNGHRIFIATPDEVVGLHATARTGHTVLERELEHVRPGDRVTITLHGRRDTADGERSYRYYTVEVAS
jgi:hypothetical protein